MRLKSKWSRSGSGSRLTGFEIPWWHYVTDCGLETILIARNADNLASHVARI